MGCTINFENFNMNSARKELGASAITCDPCRFAGKQAVAIRYCKNCYGHFCSHCSESHVKAASTKLHSLIDIVEKRSAKNSYRIREKCHDHGAVIISFCETHDALCCNFCVLTDHKDCNKVIQLSEATLGKRTFRLCKDLESDIKKLQNQFEEVQVQKQEYIISIEQQQEAISASIKMFRKSINGILNNLEDAINKKKDDICSGRTDSVKSHIKTSKTALSVLNEAYKQLDYTLKESDAEMFVRTKRVQIVVKKYSEVLAGIQPMPEREVLRFIPDSSIEKFLSGLKQLGEFKIESVKPREGSPSIAPSRYNVSDNRKPNFATDIKVRMKTDKKACYITGATFLHDGRVLLADDSNKNLKLFGTDFKSLSSLAMSSSPRDVSAISHVEVAATLPNEKLIQMLKIGTKEMEKKKVIVLDIECHGITFYKNELYVTSGWSPEREIQVYKPSGEFSRKIRLPRDVFRYPLYITIDPKSRTIYVSDYINGVIALDITGKIVLQCKNTDIATYYKGIALTTPEHIYACTWQQNGVQRVHTEGKGLETVITWKISDRRKPLAVAYTSKTRRLVLSFCGDKRDVLSIYKFY